MDHDVFVEWEINPQKNPGSSWDSKPLNTEVEVVQFCLTKSKRQTNHWTSCVYRFVMEHDGINYYHIDNKSGNNCQWCMKDHARPGSKGHNRKLLAIQVIFKITPRAYIQHRCSNLGTLIIWVMIGNLESYRPGTVHGDLQIATLFWACKSCSIGGRVTYIAR